MSISVANETYDLCRDLQNIKVAAMAVDHGEPLNHDAVPNYNERTHYNEGGLRCSATLRELSESAPDLGKMFLTDVADSFKICLYNSGTKKLNPSRMPDFHRTRDKVIANRVLGAHYDVSGYDKVDGDGLPTDMSDNEKLIAKKFLNRCLTNEEMAVYKHMLIEMYKRNIYYNHQEYFAERSLWTGQSAEFWKEVRAARETNFFNMPDPTPEEIKYCGEW